MATPKFKNISVGHGGGIWATAEKDGTLYRLYGDGEFMGWIPDKVGKGEVVAAVDFGNAWCVNKAGEIWHVVNAENLDKGGTWTKVPTHSGKADAATIVVGADGSVWYAQTDGTIFRRGPNAWYGDPTGKAAVIAAFSKAEVWCVNKKQEIWYTGNADWEGGGGPWTKLKTYSGKADAKTISVGSDRSLWYANTDGELFFYLMDGDTWRRGWTQDKIGAAVAISVNTQGNVWCVNKRGEVWRTVDNKWQQVVEIGPG